MVVPYKKVEETDTQVKNYINELSKARSFQAPGELNDEIQYVKQPTPITQTTVYKSLEGLVQEMKSKNASDTTINELNNTIKSLKEEAAVKPESNTYGDINQELKVTVAALRETSESLNEMISYFRKEAAYMNPKNEKMEVDEEKMKNKNNDEVFRLIDSLSNHSELTTPHVQWHHSNLRGILDRFEFSNPDSIHHDESKNHNN